MESAHSRRMRHLTEELNAAISAEGSEAPLAHEAYTQMRRLAASWLKRERRDHTLQPTDLVHEAYLAMRRGTEHVNDRGHFYRTASRVMRNLLLSHARRRNAVKRQGERRRVTLIDLPLPMEHSAVDLLALEQALAALEQRDARKAQLIELKFFGGLTTEATAEAMGVSTATVEREWRFTRAWLAEKLDAQK